MKILISQVLRFLSLWYAWSIAWWPAVIRFPKDLLKNRFAYILPLESVFTNCIWESIKKKNIYELGFLFRISPGGIWVRQEKLYVIGYVSSYNSWDHFQIRIDWLIEWMNGWIIVLNKVSHSPFATPPRLRLIESSNEWLFGKFGIGGFDRLIDWKKYPWQLLGQLVQQKGIQVGRFIKMGPRRSVSTIILAGPRS